MSATETHSFQAEIQQLLDIVIHSLYTDKEIFVRELISNAADALEKLRFQEASGEPVFDAGASLKISISTDDQAKTISFTDTGVGLTHDELVENIGTIARSGSKEFMKQLREAKEKTVELIGQFGVGFYSSFMVAEKVVVYTRSYRPDETGWRWSSEGAGSYEIEPALDLPRGTKVVIHLKADAAQYAKKETVEHIIKRYSNFVPCPIELNGESVNKVLALWTKNKNEITDQEYNEFYEFIGHDTEPPRYRLHFTADAPLSIKALLFVPKTSFEKFGLARQEAEVNLYCRKVLIQPKAKGLFPEWMRFVRGVVDSEDLPLNISRETMQDTSLMHKLNQVLTSRLLKMLDEESKTNVESYDAFFNEFGHCLKEGVMIDFLHRDALGKLLRFESSATEPGKKTNLTEYVSRMGSEQKEIYFLMAPTREAAEANPHYEVFRERKLEVLFLFDHRDEFVMDHLRVFDGKTLRAAEKAEIALETTGAGEVLSDDEARLLANWMKETLGARVAEVRSSKRLVDSPAVVMESDPNVTSTMRRLMKAMNRDKPAELETAPHLEINPRHVLIRRLEKMRKAQPELAAQVAEQVLDNALVAAGLLEDPRHMLKRMNDLLAQVLGEPPSAKSNAPA